MIMVMIYRFPNKKKFVNADDDGWNNDDDGWNNDDDGWNNELWNTICVETRKVHLESRLLSAVDDLNHHLILLKLIQLFQGRPTILSRTRSSLLNCAVRGDEAVYWVSIGQQ